MSFPYRSPVARWLLEQMAARPDVTQAGLARAIGVGQQRISEWLAGRKRPRELNCIRLAQFFGADPTAVLTLAGHQISAPLVDPEATAGTPTGPVAFGPPPSNVRGLRSVREEAAEWLARLPVAVPIFEKGICQKGPCPVVEYAYWDLARAAGRQIWGIRVLENPLEPDIRVGDTLFIEVGRPPAHGNLVVACLAGRVYPRRYLQQPDGAVLADHQGAIKAAEKFKILGVVIALQKDFL